MTDLSVRVVKELKGAPLSIWIALMCTRGVAVDQPWMARNTGYCDKTIRWALAYLVEHGFVIRVQDGWMLSDRTTNLPFERSQEAELTEIENDDPDLSQDRPARDQSNPHRQNGKIFHSPISIINKDSKDSHKTNNTNSVGGKNFGQVQNFSDDPALGEALLAVGINENVRTRRLLGRITPRDVRTMVARLREDPFHDLSETGLMVTILEAMAERKQRRGGYESWNT